MVEGSKESGRSFRASARRPSLPGTAAGDRTRGPDTGAPKDCPESPGSLPERDRWRWNNPAGCMPRRPALKLSKTSFESIRRDRRLARRQVRSPEAACTTSPAPAGVVRSSRSRNARAARRTTAAMLPMRSFETVVRFGRPGRPRRRLAPSPLPHRGAPSSECNTRTSFVLCAAMIAALHLSLGCTGSVLPSARLRLLGDSIQPPNLHSSPRSPFRPEYP
jgi:hypothetical protein